MLELLFTAYSSFYIFLILLFVTLIAAVVFTNQLGGRARRAAGKDTQQTRYMLIAGGLAFLTTLHLGLALLGGYAIQTTRYHPVSPLQKIFVSTSAQTDFERLQKTAGAIAVVFFGVGLWFAGGLRPEGWLRQLKVDLENPDIQRGDAGSAQLCSREFYNYLARQKASTDLRVIGAVWGKPARPGGKPRRLDRSGGNQGIVLSRKARARGISICGSPGFGKSAGLVLPLAADIMELGESLVITDPQRSLLSDILDIAGCTRHRVIVHDPTRPDLSHFNLAEGISDGLTAKAISKVLLPHQGGESFWSDSGINTLGAMLLRYDTLGQVMRSLKDMPALADTLDAYDDEAQVMAAPFISSVRDGDAKLATSFVATLGASTLGTWSNQTIVQTTNRSDFNAQLLVEQPTVVILQSPGKYAQVLGAYLGAAITRLLMDLDDIGEQNPQGDAVPIPITFLLEEFLVLGNLAAIPNYVDLVRKRSISIGIVFQSIKQLDRLYGETAAKSILSSLATNFWFSGCDIQTAQWVSTTLGNTTEPVRRKGKGDSAVKQRPLLTPEEVQSPPGRRGTCILVHRHGSIERTGEATWTHQSVMLYEPVVFGRRSDWQSRIAASPGPAQISTGFIIEGSPTKHTEPPRLMPASTLDMTAHLRQTTNHAPEEQAPERDEKPPTNKASVDSASSWGSV